MDLCTKTLSAVLDKHALVTIKCTAIRPASILHSKETQEVKCKERCAERKWSKSDINVIYTPPHKHIMVRLDLWKCLMKKESFELGFEVR